MKCYLLRVGSSCVAPTLRRRRADFVCCVAWLLFESHFHLHLRAAWRLSASVHSRPFNLFASIRLGSARFGSIRFDSVRFGSIRFDSVRFGSIRFGSARFGSIRVDSVRFGSIFVSAFGTNFDPIFGSIFG